MSAVTFDRCLQLPLSNVTSFKLFFFLTLSYSIHALQKLWVMSFSLEATGCCFFML